MSDWIDRLLEQTRPQSLLAAALAIAGLTALAGYLYVLKPALAEYRELGEAVLPAAARPSAVVLQAQARAIVELREEIAEKRDRLYGEASQVPRHHTESWIIDRLDRLSGRHRIQLVGVTPEGGEQVPLFEELPYDVQVKGGYFDLFRWLNDLERELRPLVVKEFEMAGEGGSRRVAMRLRLVAYRPSGGDA